MQNDTILNDTSIIKRHENDTCKNCKNKQKTPHCNDSCKYCKETHCQMEHVKYCKKKKRRYKVK